MKTFRLLFGTLLFDDFLLFSLLLFFMLSLFDLSVEFSIPSNMNNYNKLLSWGNSSNSNKDDKILLILAHRKLDLMFINTFPLSL